MVERSGSFLSAPEEVIEAALSAELARVRGAGALEVLGVEDASAARAAFLQATKRYHPALFGCRSAAVRALAQEIFLLIKDAYHALSAGDVPPRPADPRPAVGRPSAAPAAGRPSPSAALAVGRQSSSVPPAAGRPSSSAAPAEGRRSPTAPALHAARTASPRPAAGPKPVAGPRPAAASPARSESEATVSSPAARPAAHPLRNDLRERRKERLRARLGAVTSPATPAPPKDPNPEETFEAAKAQLARGEKTAAAAAFKALAVAKPSETRFRLYMHFARAQVREEEGAHAEARAEYKRALGLDAEFAPAERALARLAGEDSKKSSGLFSRLFGKE